MIMFAPTTTRLHCHGHRLSSRARRAPLNVALGAGLMLAALAGSVGAPLAHAAAPSPLPGLSKGLNGASSYRVDLTVTSAGTAVKGTLVMVRGKNGKAQYHLTLNSPAGAGTGTAVDTVIVGSRVCVKEGAAQPYRCVNSPAVAAQLNADPSAIFQSAGRTTTFTPVAGKTVLGQPCNGYSFALNTAAGAHARGTLYVSAVNGRLREEDVTATGKSASTGKIATATTTAIWSRYDDPTLKIPAIPPA